MTERWQREKKKEHYYRQAKKEGYRSRAAYKLKQINKKYNVIRKGDAVIDLGAAPGGWSQIAKEAV
ncbi:MAG: RlmE family RNA methyltransferase, partial [Thermoplasmatales archaeon]|nr:RlmE family RNA methyltransferase [Thermoplasmatales archaeon]